ncbi:MAG TPA: GNAT family N-acetyltransferase [Chitinophagaceae bacterium]|jgi:predicted GNAT family acetyltransferase|nr:GNAT family N-acetyltransferase [Chitinophagaceae bacterium]
MTIEHKQKDAKGMFFIQGDDGVLAEIVYAVTGNKMIIEHTEVDEELRGENIGFQLVSHVVDYARTHQHKVVPVCGFAKAVFDKKPEFRDVLA